MVYFSISINNYDMLNILYMFENNKNSITIYLIFIHLQYLNEVGYNKY